MAFNEEHKVVDQTNSDNENEQEIAACVKEVVDLKETCKRVAADFENFKKRVERDKVTWSHMAQAEVLRNALPVVDDFDRAMAEYGKIEKGADHQAWLAGFDLIRKAFDKFLQTYGVTVIEQLEHFDPEFHEAIAQVESPAHESGAIVDVVQKGYMFDGQVLRVARVTVAK